MKVAVIGHVEWCHFVKVDHVPVAGEIVRSTDSWHEAAGGGGAAAAELYRLAGNCLFITSVGNDYGGEQSLEQLKGLGIEVYSSVVNDQPTKEAFIHIDKNKERTITVNDGLKPSALDHSLPWDKLKDMDAIYFVSGDLEALKLARQARVLVSTARILDTLKGGNVQLDALVMSQKDSEEQYKPGSIVPEPNLVVMTQGTGGGITQSGHSYEVESVRVEDLKDTYGCGDCFAAGLTYGLAQGVMESEVLKIAAHSGAEAAKRSGSTGLKK